MRRRTLLLVVAATVLLSSLTTWIASAQIRSPAEIAARTAAPDASPILVPVVKRKLATKVVSRGTAHYGSPHELLVPSSELKSGPQVITSLPRAGSVIDEGRVLLTISGRPVFLFDGARPAYRDLGPGMTGKDVAQLEQALKRSGVNPGRVDGRYDEATGRAVTALYNRRGYHPLVATDQQLESVRPTEADLVKNARARAGVQVPVDEVLFVAATPVRVTELPTPLGESSDGVLVTVTDSNVVIDGLLHVDQAGLVKPGAEVVIDEPALGIKATGRVSQIAGRPGTNGADGFHVAFKVAVTNPPATLVGASVRLTVPIKAASAAQLTVPVSAVSLGPDGGSRVQRARGDKSEFVPVETGVSADGYVGVTPRQGELADGDLVVVGIEGDQGSGQS
ncbi:MAG: peptidoglycan-binding protein [Nocardioidaceae bacterium]